jgi:hypothetical protein
MPAMRLSAAAGIREDELKKAEDRRPGRAFAAAISSRMLRYGLSAFTIR